ncbi:uncharacterized protein LOC120780733 [Bactrocera tryoni]|uniref:uncharacterized protein LOC120780733 n=1 Tax=Bactrocera tryoni TaxID=59916 RepID=UPI001A972E6F|nr:uncharacterized protein LOC120780733 [Bactrocera tryoni]
MKGSTGGISRGALARKLKSDRRLATKIVERSGGKHAGQVSEQHANTLEWAKEVRSESETDRARLETKGPEPACKSAWCARPQQGGCAISHEEWKRVAAAISSVFLRVVKGNPGPNPKCVSAGWHHGLHKLTRCADERSAILYKEAVSLEGEVWKGARLEAVDKADLPLRPRARVWLPAEPSIANEIEEILKYCNPSLPTHDWRVIRLERTDEPYRQALVMLNEEPIGPLSKTKGAISYGFEMVVLNVLPTDTGADGTQAADAEEKADGVSDGQATIENDPNLSDVASSGGGSSIGDSVFSLEKLFEEVRVDHDISAELALLEESLKDEIPPD